MYKEQTNVVIKKPDDIQARQIREQITRECRRSWKYTEMSLISSLTGALLWLALRALFDNGVDAWANNPEATRVKDLMNVAVYVLPLIFLSFSAATFILMLVNDTLAWRGVAWRGVLAVCGFCFSESKTAGPVVPTNDIRV